MTPLRVFVRSFLSRELFSGSLRPAAPRPNVSDDDFIFMCISGRSFVCGDLAPRRTGGHRRAFRAFDPAHVAIQKKNLPREAGWLEMLVNESWVGRPGGGGCDCQRSGPLLPRHQGGEVGLVVYWLVWWIYYDSVSVIKWNKSGPAYVFFPSENEDNALGGRRRRGESREKSSKPESVFCLPPYPPPLSPSSESSKTVSPNHAFCQIPAEALSNFFVNVQNVAGHFPDETHFQQKVIRVLAVIVLQETMVCRV